MTLDAYIVLDFPVSDHVGFYWRKKCVQQHIHVIFSLKKKCVPVCIYVEMYLKTIVQMIMCLNY